MIYCHSLQRSILWIIKVSGCWRTKKNIGGHVEINGLGGERQLLSENEFGIFYKILFLARDGGLQLERLVMSVW